MNRVLATLLVAAIAFAACDVVLFWTPLYRPLLDPASSAGAFEETVDRLRAFPSDRRRDVLVLGDSRIYSGLDPAQADHSAGGLRFLDGSVAGTTPRCWLYLIRAIDPQVNRFRAIVVPVDTYADDDSAIGSLDGDDRPFDLHYVLFQTGPVDAWQIARTFSDPRKRIDYAINLWLRGPLLRDDLQGLLADPLGRLAAARAARTSPSKNAPTAAHPRHESLAGLRVDFVRDAIEYPAAATPAQREAIVRQVLRRAQPSPSYARYREHWLAALVARYRVSETRIIFVRIPTRPLHRSASSGPPSGSLAGLALRGAASFLPQAPYVALEQPALFADDNHLNADGMRRFSARLGSDVAAALRGKAGATVAVAVREQPTRTSEHAVGTSIQAKTTNRLRLGNIAILLGAGAPIQFQTLEFFVFFVLVAALFYSLPRRAGRIVLLCASWYFYSRWNAWYVVFLVGLTISDYAIARWMASIPDVALRQHGGKRMRPRSVLLGAGIAANLAFLSVFKYANFTTGTLAALLGLQHDPWLVAWIVPIGISFHTFQSISYLVDVYRGRILAIRDPLDYALYIAFFPQLLAGPIVRAERFFGELYGWRRPDNEGVLRGIGEITLGLVKKTVFADQLAAVADAYFAAPGAQPGAAAAWSAVLAFAFQIYFDFSGYSDIAIGCARLLGFDFPPNFRHPYLATSIGDFWRRWHISLSSWLRDYLYISLGGNRHGRIAAYRNLMLTMLLGGLWHGANWTFVTWGGYHGALLAGERAANVGWRNEPIPGGLVRLARVLLTFVLVSLGWILFRAQTFGGALLVARSAFTGGAGPWLLPLWICGLVAFALSCEYAQEHARISEWLMRAPLRYGVALSGLFLVLETLAYPGKAPLFIYFKF